MEADLNIVKKCNTLLHERVVELEKNCLNTSQYIRREMIEVSKIPLSIGDDVLENKVCAVLSLTDELVQPSDLESCHRLKDRSKIICKFKSRKKRYAVMSKRKNLGLKKNELKELGIEEKVYLQDSLCVENQKLFYFSRKLAKSDKVYSTWFFNNVINIQLQKDAKSFKIYHISDLEKLLNIPDVYIFLKNLNLI